MNTRRPCIFFNNERTSKIMSQSLALHLLLKLSPPPYDPRSIKFYNEKKARLDFTENMYKEFEEEPL